MFALATAYRWRAEQAAVGDEPVGWQRWRRQLLQQNRDKVIIFAQGWDGIFHVAEYSLLLGVKLQEPPPEIGKDRRRTHRARRRHGPRDCLDHDSTARSPRSRADTLGGASRSEMKA